MWGDGLQTRSFLYIDECLEGVEKLINSDFVGPVNIGSEEMVSINQLAELIMKIAGKKLRIKHIDGPLGVRGRNSDNKLIAEKLNWKPNRPLVEGLTKTYKWIDEMVKKEKVKKINMTSKALITGITGQDGSYLAEFLLGKGYEVHGLIRRASTFNTSRIEHLYVDPHQQGVKLFGHYGDLSDGSRLTNLIYDVRPDEIYNRSPESC